MKILVVEDDRLLNTTLCYNLSAAGYEVEAALSKSVAERLCGKRNYNLIVLDVNLPDGNGFDFCRDIKDRSPDTAVIFLTANDMESDMLRGYELGADDYVTKPFPMSVFQKKVAALLARIKKQSDGDCYNDGNLYVNFSEMAATLNGEVYTNYGTVGGADRKLDSAKRRVGGADRKLDSAKRRRLDVYERTGRSRIERIRPIGICTCGHSTIGIPEQVYPLPMV